MTQRFEIIQRKQRWYNNIVVLDPDLKSVLMQGKTVFLFLSGSQSTSSGGPPRALKCRTASKTDTPRKTPDANELFLTASYAPRYWNR